MSRLQSTARRAWHLLTGRPGSTPGRFAGSAAYWEQRYKTGETSGAGSYGRLAEFKAGVLNGLVRELKIESIVEFGCGDGNQLRLAEYPRYVGLDVSPSAIQLCKNLFAADPTKSFFLFDPFCFVDHHRLFEADATFSLDVLYHLVEDATYEAYMATLFGSARRYVMVYSTDYDQPRPDPHVRHRRFADWVRAKQPRWSLIRHIPNRYPPAQGDDQPTSPADFFVFANA